MARAACQIRNSFFNKAFYDQELIRHAFASL
jgi:hypothetical protein